LHNNAGSGHAAGLRGLVINANDPGQESVVMSVGALGNSSGAPLDGSHDMSFGESAVDEECAMDGEQDSASILAAWNVPAVCNPNDPNVVNPTTVDPEMIGALMFRRSAMDP